MAENGAVRYHNSYRQNSLMLGFCPGYTPSRDFLENAAQWVSRIVTRYNIEYADALDDVVRSLMIFKLNKFKKDHRIWLYKGMAKRSARRPLTDHELKLMEDIRGYISANYYEPTPNKESTESLESPEDCPTHKKDCHTWLHKFQTKYQDVKRAITCLWFNQNKKRYLSNKAQYFGLERKSSVKVRFQNSDDESEEDLTKLDRSQNSLDSNQIAYPVIERNTDLRIRSSESLSNDEEGIILPNTPSAELRSSKRDMRLSNSDGFNYEYSGVSPLGYSPTREAADYSGDSCNSEGWEKLSGHAQCPPRCISISHIMPDVPTNDNDDNSDDEYHSSAQTPHECQSTTDMRRVPIQLNEQGDLNSNSKGAFR